MAAPEDPQRVVDFGAGTHPLAETCRAVLVLLELDDNDNVVGPDLGELAAFVPTFDNWYRRACGFEHGTGRKHLMYRREIGVGTPIRPSRWPQIRPVAHACRDVGLGFSMTLDLRAMADERSALDTLLEDGSVRGISIAFDDDNSLFSRAAPALDALHNSQIPLSFAGPATALLDSRLLDEQRWSGRHLSIEPTPTRMPGDAIRDQDPCWRRFRLTIDAAGNLYPCFGLVGTRAGRLGHIRGPMSETVLGGASTGLDLQALARTGPTIHWNSALQDSATGLPPICTRHRAALTSGAS